MSESTWSDVKKGDVVELSGRMWTVTKIKRVDKKRVKIAVEHKGRVSKGVMKAKDRVTIVAPKKSYTQRMNEIQGVKPVDIGGVQQRWASEKELKKAMTQGLPPGDQSQRKPRAKAKGDPWESQADRTEKKLDEILGARLIAISKDETGFYVPPVDVSTVAAHLAVFHGGIPGACEDDEAQMLKAHDAQHAAAKKGEGVLEVNHWHTETRP